MDYIYAEPVAMMKIRFGEDVPILNTEGRFPPQQVFYLMQNKNMQGQYLGACLETCRFGAGIGTYYPATMHDICAFVQSWLEQNKNEAEGLFYYKPLNKIHPGAELPYSSGENESDKESNKVLSLEDVLERLCSRKLGDNNIFFPFDGWMLAKYVEKWYSQTPRGTAPLYKKNFLG